MKKLKRVFMAGGAVALSAAPALAVTPLDLTGVTVDTASPMAAAAIVVAGGAALWGVRKVIKLFNRS